MFYGPQLLICMPRWSIVHALLQHTHTSDENLNTPWSCHSGAFPAHFSVREGTGKGGRWGKGKQEADGDWEGLSDIENTCHRGGLPILHSVVKNPPVMQENSAPWYVAAGVGGVCGGERIHVCIWLSPFPFSWNCHRIANWLYVRAWSLNCVWLLATPQAPLSVGFSRQEYWSGLPCPPPGDLPDPEIKPRFPTLQADSLSYEPPGKPKNTGVGSLSLLQGIFPTQESNQGLSCIAGGFFTNWATREAPNWLCPSKKIKLKKIKSTRHKY